MQINFLTVQDPNSSRLRKKVTNKNIHLTSLQDTFIKNISNHNNTNKSISFQSDGFWNYPLGAYMSDADKEAIYYDAQLTPEKIEENIQKQGNISGIKTSFHMLDTDSVSLVKSVETINKVRNRIINYTVLQFEAIREVELPEEKNKIFGGFAKLKNAALNIRGQVVDDIFSSFEEKQKSMVNLYKSSFSPRFENYIKTNEFLDEKITPNSSKDASVMKQILNDSRLGALEADNRLSNMIQNDHLMVGMNYGITKLFVNIKQCADILILPTKAIVVSEIPVNILGIGAGEIVDVLKDEGFKRLIEISKSACDYFPEMVYKKI